MQDGIIPEATGVGLVTNRFLARHIGWLLAMPGGRLLRRFERAARDVATAQDRVLMEIVEAGRNTVFGNQHHFDQIHNYEQFARNVPISDYEQMRPYIQRHIQGEDGVLFHGKPLMYTRTSGTTAEPKMIPVTRFNFERTIRNRGKLWLYNLNRQFPGIFSGKDFTLVSPAVDGHTDDGVPFGALSGLIYQNIPGFVKLLHTVPYEAVCIRAYQARAYVLLRFGMPSSVSAIFTGNPATVLNLAQKGNEWKTDIIKDIHDGTLNGRLEIEPEIRATLEARLRPAPKRAAELEQLASRTERLRPIDYWPNLKLVHTWTNGNCKLVLPELTKWVGAVPILDFGYIASEITAADMVEPTTNGSLLAVLSGFYEFSPFEEGTGPTRFLRAHQLEQNERYYIYVTTYSGLYRYNMNDVVEVVGHHGEVPIFKFLYKGDGVTSLQGEKLSEEQLIMAMGQAAAGTGCKLGFFMGYADSDENRYEVFAELSGADSALGKRFGEALDEQLCEVNIEYAAKRRTERLGPPVIRLLKPNAFSAYRQARLANGAFEGQFKWVHLVRDSKVRALVANLVVDS